MPEPRHWHLIFYDVADDARRTQIHAVLRRWGDPVQLSVFQLRCTARELARVRFELTGHLDESVDRLTIVRLCASCSQRVANHGEPLTPMSHELPSCHFL